MALRTRARRRQSLPSTGPSHPTGSDPTDIDATLELFEGLSDRQLKRVRRELTVMSIRPGKVISRQGDIGRDFVVVLDGQVAVIHDGIPLAVLEAGCHFGELPMLHSAHAPHLRASFHALGPVRIAVANRRQFGALLDLFPVVADRVVGMAEVRLAFIDHLDAERAAVREEEREHDDVADEPEHALLHYPVHLPDAHLA